MKVVLYCRQSELYQGLDKFEFVQQLQSSASVSGIFRIKFSCV